jgi:metal-responsive CopG/Arc/MetJ family transcriptional regulator
MKTAVSIPDTVYTSAEKLAKRLGKSRSQLYAQALSNYLSKHQKEDVTTKLNEVYLNNDSKVDPLLISLQVQSLSREDW